MTREEVVAYLEEQAKLPFEWGVTDCVQFAAGSRARFGFPSELPKYSSEEEANALREAAGSLQKLVEEKLGPMRRDIQNVSDGATVLTAFDAGQALGVALLPCFFIRTTNGLRPVTLELAIGYWPCPHS